MSWLTLCVLVVIGMLITGFAATASKALQEFSRRELEVYSRRRSRTDRFGAILDDYEQAAIGLESLQIVGTALLTFSLFAMAINLCGGLSEITAFRFAAAVAICSLTLLSVTTWIPEAVIALWTAPLIFHSWPWLQLITWAMWPLTLGVKVVGALFRRLADRPEEEDDEEEAFEDEILSVVTEGLHDGVLEKEEREMIAGVIELGDTDVLSIMTPRSNLDALDVRLSWEEVQAFVVKAGRTRIPVYEGALDNVIGILYVKDLLKELSVSKSEPRKSLRDLLRKPWRVPTTKPLDELLQEFLHTRNHLALVIDEYTSVAGVVTIEDVLEEIVGEIVDEFDYDEVEEFQRINDRTAEVLGTVHLNAINDRLGLELDQPDDCDTLAGLVIAHLGRIPKVGEAVEFEEARVTVLEATRRRIERLRVEIARAPSETDDERDADFA
ncbi:MAG: HlyC/CorC family transporter [Planctomycetes bacterium]|nr:HlyC/CorC family transporter [Planctomycetota bacterium]